MERRERVLTLRVADIRPNPHQPRQTFDDEGLRELASSIRRHGILQPLTVRSAGGGKWELVAGERRLRAAKLAGLEKVPCIRREADDRESALLALVENLQRRDLHYLEEAAAIAAYIRQTGITQEEAAAQLGRSPSALANKLRLLRLSPACRELLVQNGLTERHARALLRLSNETAQLAALEHIAARGLNVAQTESYVERLLDQADPVPPSKSPTYIIKDVRLFLNSIDRGLQMMRQGGVAADVGRRDTDSEILLTIRIPKQRTAS